MIEDCELILDKAQNMNKVVKPGNISYFILFVV